MGLSDNNNIFKERLKVNLQGELPGLKAQLKMVPERRRQEVQNRNWDDNVRKAAVLICLYPCDSGSIELALIRRNEYDGVHSGQISFPGGGFEDSDSDLVQTALREAEEEIGISASAVEVLGHITPVYIPPSNFYVLPVVGWLAGKPLFRPDASEVQEVLSLSLDEVIATSARQLKTIEHREFSQLEVPCFYVSGHIIWGATAMMLSEFIDILRLAG